MADGKSDTGEALAGASLEPPDAQLSDIEAIQAGLDDFEAGRYQPFEEFMIEFEKRKGIVSPN